MVYLGYVAHYGHKNICKGITEWDDADISCRDFQTIEEMNDAIVNSINKYVMEDDVLYHLGDWSFGGIENIWNFRKRIKCKNVHLILGNHDDHIKKNKILPNCKWGHHYESIEDWSPSEDEPVMEDTPVRTKDLFTSVQKYLEIEIDKKIVVLCHFAFEEWYEMDHKGSYHFQGHSHGKLNSSETNTIYRRFDVGCDTNNLKPYSWIELKEILNKHLIKKH